jgi:hypothetical protein
VNHTMEEVNRNYRVLHVRGEEIDLLRDDNGVGYVSEHPYPVADVRDLVSLLRADSVTADMAPDAFDPRMAWLYVGGAS